MALARLLVRPAAVLAAALLIVGVVQAGPAAANPADGPALSVTVFPSPELIHWPGGGESPEHPANLGPMPASVPLRATITNTGSETLQDFHVTTGLAGGRAGEVTGCDYNPEGVQLPPSDGPILLPGLFAQCWGLGLSGVMDDKVVDLVTTVTARGAESGTEVTVDKHYYAIAQDDTDKVGDRVWLDTDRDGVQDDGEPGIPGVRLTVTGPDGKPAPDVIYPGEVVGPQTTDADGHYLFKHLPTISDGERYTVTVDPGSPALTGLEPTQAGVGSSATDSSTSPGQSSEWMGGDAASDTTVDFGFVSPPEDPPAPSPATVTLTADASPEPAIVGSTITVKGTITKDGRAFKASTVLEFQADGSTAYTKVKTVKSSNKGKLSATTTATRSGTFRYRYVGDADTAAGVSSGDHVDVRKATVALTADASPESPTKGATVKVKGTITREGKKFKASVVLEFRSDDDDAYAKVKTVKSSSKGKLSASVKAGRSGSYRYRYAGSSTTEAGASGGDHIVVKPKPPSTPKPKTYKNCTALTKVYPHGVGRSGARDKGGDVTDFTRDTKTYNLNKKSDRDKDGIACER